MPSWITGRFADISSTLGLLLLLAFIRLSTGFCQVVTLQSFHDVHRAMGTEFSIDIYAPDAATAQQWMVLSFDEIDRVEDLLSNYRLTSELSRVSRQAGTRPVTTDPETFAFLRRSLAWSRRSHGAFDITVGPAMRAWGFFFNHGRIPTAGELQTLRRETGWRFVRLDLAQRTVYFSNGKNMELDAGGIGKGYAVDRVVTLLRRHNVTAALISAGTSTIYALGAPPGSKGWRVSIPDLAEPKSVLTEAVLTDTSLSTSACTEKFFIINGHRYCHILNPTTMRPVEGMLQTTIVTPSATDSDALSTATFVLGPSRAMSLLRSCPQTSAVFISDSKGRVVYRTFRWPYPLRLGAK